MLGAKRRSNPHATASFMRKNVDEPPERIAHVKAPHAPGLACRAVFDRPSGGEQALMDLVEIVDLDGKVRDRRSRAAFARDADLRRGRRLGGEGHPPTVV